MINIKEKVAMIVIVTIVKKIIMKITITIIIITINQDKKNKKLVDNKI